MNKRQYLLSLKKYQGEYMQNILKEKSEEEINRIYENEILTQKIKKEGINLVRVNYYDKETEKELQEFIKENNLKQYKDHNISKATYHGNFCLPYIIEEHAIKIKEKFNDKVRLDLKRHILGSKEVENINVGEKVIINAPNFIGGTSASKGTVYAKDDKKVTIRKYRSKTKGWHLEYGKEGSIKKGWN